MQKVSIAEVIVQPVKTKMCSKREIMVMLVVVLKVNVRVVDMVTNEGQGEVVMVFNYGDGASDDDVDLWMFTRDVNKGMVINKDVYKMFTIWQPMKEDVYKMIIIWHPMKAEDVYNMATYEGGCLQGWLRCSSSQWRCPAGRGPCKPQIWKIVLIAIVKILIKSNQLDQVVYCIISHM